MPSYADWLRFKGYANRTIGDRTIIYRNRLAAWGTFHVELDSILEWLSSYEGWTRLSYQQHLANIYEWMIDTGQWEGPNPVRQIRSVPTPRPRPRPLNESDLARALAAATPQVRAFLLLGYLAGLRAHEIAKFHGSDISEQQIRVVGKGSVLAYVPTHPMLWELAQTFPRDGYWFPSRVVYRDAIRGQTVSNNVGALFRDLGIKGSTHRTRHTYGTTLLRGGANLRVVQELMRHRSLATTALYLGVDEQERVDAIGLLAA